MMTMIDNDYNNHNDNHNDNHDYYEVIRYKTGGPGAMTRLLIEEMISMSSFQNFKKKILLIGCLYSRT